MPLFSENYIVSKKSTYLTYADLVNEQEMPRQILILIVTIMCAVLLETANVNLKQEMALNVTRAVIFLYLKRESL